MCSWAFAQSATSGAIDGDVTTQHGTIELAGALVSLVTNAGAIVQQSTDGQGHFRIQGLQPGRYRIQASLDGFNNTVQTITVNPGATATVELELSIRIAEAITVTARAEAASAVNDATAQAAIIGSRDIDQFAPGGSVQEAMRLLAAVIDVPGGLSIKGGRPEQSGVQLGTATIVEPSTGLAPLIMPADAVAAVAVLPNPYDVEFGRFSSGLVVITTSRADDKWRFRLNDLDPDLRTKRSQNLSVIGVKAFTPRLEIAGPVVKGRLFLEQAVQYSYRANDVASRPENEVAVDRWLSTFTRADVNATARQSYVMSGGVFRDQSADATLGTFVPPDATVKLNRGMTHASAIAHSVWSAALLSESTLGVQSYDMASDPYGNRPMELRPDTTLGNFFNRQRRDTASYQFAHTLTATGTALGATHDAKLGGDLLASTYSGTSASGPVLIERPDGTLARRLDYVGPTTEDIRSLDAALFAEDRAQLSDRWLVEFGVRLDRDGILHRVNVAPRTGFALALNRSRTSMLRGGVGLFSERTPGVAGVFEQFQSTVDARFAADGTTPLAAPILYANTVASGLRTAQSRVWSLSYEQRASASWSWHAAVLDRRGVNELIVDPVAKGGAGGLLLSSNGRSRYRDAEIGAHFTHAPVDVEGTYTRSSARSDLNAFTTLFGPVLAPVIGSNAYGPAGTDAPNRLFLRGRFQTQRWLLLGLSDWHTGFPYSAVDSALDFVGPRNLGYRLPTTRRTEIGVERRVRIAGVAPWIGVRVDNPFNTFSPADVQANLASPDFGALYNSPYRKTRIIVRFER